MHLPLAFTHDDVRGVGVRVHHDPVFAGLSCGEGEVRRVDLEHLVGLQPTHADTQGALGQLQLGDPVVETEHGDAGPGAHANRGTAHLDFRPRPCICPQAVAQGQRPIDRGLDPFVITRR